DVVVPPANAARIFGPGALAVASGSIPTAAVDEPAADKVVVIADDSISVRKFVGRILEKAGYCVKLASDGLEAAELVAQVGCHLVITDLVCRLLLEKKNERRPRPTQPPDVTAP